jgi:fused signal recognition particle receptor
MFNLFKKGIKGVLSKFSKKVEEAPEETVEEVIEEKVEVIEEKPEEPKPVEKAEKKADEKVDEKAEEIVEIEEKDEEVLEAPTPVEKVIEEKVEVAEPSIDEKEISEEKVEEIIEEKIPEVEEVKPEIKVEEKKPEKKPVEVAEEKKGFFGRISQTFTTKKIDESKFDDMFWDLEIMLLENNVAVQVIDKIKADLKSELVGKPLPRGKVEEIIANSLHNSMEDLFNIPPIDFLNIVKSKKPYVICFVGINGSGKTTTIAKVANLLKNQGLSVVLAAADTFRAAAIDQLQVHADNLGVKLIKHDYGSDPAAVAFDAIKHAKSTEKDIVLIDTAGRLHSNVNLMQEMKKIIRVAQPDLKLFVGESITGNDCIEQAEKFNEAIGIDGLVLSKADIDEKGGAAISVSYVTKKPIVFLGVGQEYKDLELFDKEKMLSSIGL